MLVRLGHGNIQKAVGYRMRRGRAWARSHWERWWLNRARGEVYSDYKVESQLNRFTTNFMQSFQVLVGCFPKQWVRKKWTIITAHGQNIPTLRKRDPDTEVCVLNHAVKSEAVGIFWEAEKSLWLHKCMRKLWSSLGTGEEIWYSATLP